MLCIQEIHSHSGIPEATAGESWVSVAAKAIIYMCSRVITNTSNNGKDCLGYLVWLKPWYQCLISEITLLECKCSVQAPNNFGLTV